MAKESDAEKNRRKFERNYTLANFGCSFVYKKGTREYSRCMDKCTGGA